MFSLKSFSAGIKDKILIKDINLDIDERQIHVIMGPNGAGKSTLAKAIMGHPDLICSGSIVLEGRDIIALSPDERSREGLFLSFQKPEEVDGLAVDRFIRKARAAHGRNPQGMDELERVQMEIESNARLLGMDPGMTSRSLNVGFSGGEKKRIEMLQALSLDPKVVVMDEIDSGLDVDGVRLIAEALEKMRDDERCFLLITHYPRILRYFRPDKIHVMVGGMIVESGSAKLSEDIEESGYSRWTD